MKVPVDEFLCLKQLTELWQSGQEIDEAVKVIWDDARQNGIDLDEADIRDYVLARAIGNVLSLVDAEDYDDFIITDPVDNWHTQQLFSMGYIGLGDLQTYRSRKKLIGE